MGNGFTSVGDVTVSSVSYVAGYVIKKAKESQDIDYGDRKPEYVTMSRRPGIGRAFYDRYSSDIYPADSVIINGKEVKPPGITIKFWLLTIQYCMIRFTRKG